MSLKIYNEVVSKFNEKTQKWETIYEDSYQHDGPVDLAQEEMESITEVKEAIDLHKKLNKEVERYEKGLKDASEATKGITQNLATSMKAAGEWVETGKISKANYIGIANMADKINDGNMDIIDTQHLINDLEAELLTMTGNRNGKN